MLNKQSNAFATLRAEVFAANHVAASTDTAAFYDGAEPALAIAVADRPAVTSVLTIELTPRHAKHANAFSTHESR